MRDTLPSIYTHRIENITDSELLIICVHIKTYRILIANAAPKQHPTKVPSSFSLIISLVTRTTQR